MLISLARRAPLIALASAAILAIVEICSTTGKQRLTTDIALEQPGLPSRTALPSAYYVDPASPAARQAEQWEAQGRSHDAALMRRISERPAAKWLTGGHPRVRDEVEAFVGQAAIAGQMPVLVAHYLPERDCGRLTAGGAGNAQEYVNWIREFAAGINGRPAVVIVEPNAVADAVDGCIKKVAERYALLRDAINVLKSTGSTRVYLDAGHPQWVKNVEKLAAGLNRAGIDRADGFALNVANFFSVTASAQYGHRISDALGGEVPFVIDTSRNGAGPYPKKTAGGAPSWCNPPGRALGADPTDNTGLDRVDALLWIKYPGESDGPCRPGEPGVGVWWPEYALDLASRSAEVGGS